MNKKISEWIDSGQYKTEISNALSNIVKVCSCSKSEAETASYFENEIYYLIRKNTGIALKFSQEKPVKGIRHNFGNLSNRTSGSGRLDSVVNGLVIEYKHYSKLKTENEKLLARHQTEDYLYAIKNSTGKELNAILTDGINIQYFSFSGNIVKSTLLRPICVDDIDAIIKGIVSNDCKKFVPENICRDFSLYLNDNSDTRKIAKTLFKTLTSCATEKTSMLYCEWLSLMHLSLHDNGKSRDIEKRRNDLSLIFDYPIQDNQTEYYALFALNTAFAIIVKLIACKAAYHLNFNKYANVYNDLTKLTSEKIQEFFQQLEDGYSYSSLGIQNFLEGDFFSWYADKEQWSNDFSKNIQHIIFKIDEYSTFSLDVDYNPRDIFKDLYMGIIPQSVRHSMGEYFTPEWLASSVIQGAREIGKKQDWTALDPCCGSGIFLIALIKEIAGNASLLDFTKEQRKDLISRIISRVHGIDINPLSVLAARVSYFMALNAIGEVNNIEIPVYLGDSAIIPIIEKVGCTDCYRYSISNQKTSDIEVFMPVRLVNSNDFTSLMYSLQALIKAENQEALYNSIISKFNKQEAENQELLVKIRQLSENLVMLHTNHWDGIWIRIITNFLMIARLKEFDFIVGNPPWVKWEHLPTAYTNKIKKLCDIRNIFCNDGGLYGGAQLNICALIANVAATNWLSNQGILAFLMPDSIMAQNSYEEFRNFYITPDKTERLYIQKLDRWLPPLRPFKIGKKSVTQDFISYYFSRKQKDYQIGIEVNAIKKKNGISDEFINSFSSFSELSDYFEIERQSARQLSKKSTAFTFCNIGDDYFDLITGSSAYLYRTGVESTPFEVFKLVGCGKSQTLGNYRFTNKTLKTSRYKVRNMPFGGWDLPTYYIYPMLEGPNIKPFKFSCENNFHIIPYEKTDTSNPVPFEEISKDNQGLAIYFALQKDLLEKQSDKSKTMHRGSEFYSLSKIGNYTFAPYIVAVRDNSDFCATVIDKKSITPWGEEKEIICVKHTIIISQNIRRENITLDEAYYICGILNSTVVHNYIHKTFKTNGFSLNKAHIFIPEFDKNNDLMAKITSLSKKASTDVNEKEIEQIRNDLSETYIKLCENYNR